MSGYSTYRLLTEIASATQNLQITHLIVSSIVNNGYVRASPLHDDQQLVEAVRHLAARGVLLRSTPRNPNFVPGEDYQGAAARLRQVVRDERINIEENE